ncbi:MAG: DUF2589 domain-containing protein [Humidesulfovibrio sp.]|uniref:DUF2589 domain-containing protein n=1 Tax=Humidesulfovibrio sp. TaxID=2910988 RepID=UPI002737574F|nr:DUF2589 domain-containing protein [Humidesulfovibrio sp.]MDP2848890.1 DUF2589 domain-containing protein [Humidesulfovibrio sp.]
MASNIQLNDLIEALAGAVIEAQDSIEQHQISNLLGYFDENNRPKSLVVRLPSIHPQAEEGSEDLYRAPLLPLVSSNMLKIKDVEITFDVDLGQFTEEPAPDPKRVDSGGQDDEASRKGIFVDIAGSKQSKSGSIHVVLRVESTEPTDGASRLMNHLSQTQGVYKTFKAD